VTLTGPGGSGKTRLAVGVAEKVIEMYADGLYFIPLAPVTTVEQVLHAIAEVLGLPADAHTADAFYDHLANSSALVILDNLEQLHAADRAVADLLDRCRHLTVLATSRRPLAVPGEHVYPVPPLELPAGPGYEDAAAAGAVQMFIQSAQLVTPRFTLSSQNAADVAEICRRLDGLPLALELTAARTRLLTPKALLTRLDHALDFAASTTLVEARQKTLRDTINWSYQLLPPAQRALFRRLGVFAGGADLEAVAAVASDTPPGEDPLDGLVTLVDASLVTLTESSNGEPRIGLLESIRAFALEQLSREGEIDTFRDRHLRHYEVVTERIRHLWWTPDHFEAAAQFEEDLDNSREALAISLDDRRGLPDRKRLERSVSLARTVTYLMSLRGHNAEAVKWRRIALERAEQAGLEPSTLSGLHGGLAWFVGVLGDYDTALRHAESALRLANESGDETSIVSARVEVGAMRAARGEVEQARLLLTDVIEDIHASSSPIGSPSGHSLADALWNASEVLFLIEGVTGNVTAQTAVMAQLDEQSKLSSSPFQTAFNAVWSAENAWRRGHPQLAHSRLLDVLDLALRNPLILLDYVDTCILVTGTTSGELSTRLLGAADTARQQAASKRDGLGSLRLKDTIESLQQQVHDWPVLYELGRGEPIENLVREWGHWAASRLQTTLR